MHMMVLCFNILTEFSFIPITTLRTPLHDYVAWYVLCVSDSMSVTLGTGDSLWYIQYLTCVHSSFAFASHGLLIIYRRVTSTVLYHISLRTVLSCRSQWFHLQTIRQLCSLLHMRKQQGLLFEHTHIPNHLGVLINTPVRAEEAHAGDAGDGLGEPGLLVLVGLVDEPVRVDVALEVVRDEVVVAVVDDGVDERGELARVAEGAGLDGVEGALEHGVQVEFGVEVRMPEVLDVFGEVAEEEDVFFADFPGCERGIEVSGFSRAIEKDLGVLTA